MTLFPAPASAESTILPCGQSWDEWTHPVYGYTGWLEGGRVATFTILPSHDVLPSHYVNWSIAGFGSAQGKDKVDIHPDDDSWVQFNTDFGRGLGKMYTISLSALSCSPRGVHEARVTVRDFDTQNVQFAGSVTAY
jgi:hypothetical protein